MIANTTLLFGLGSPHGDDQAGWVAVRAVAEASSQIACRLGSSPLDLLDILQSPEARCERLIICDACRGNDPPGSVRRWEGDACFEAGSRGAGSHGVSLPQAIALLRQLGIAPQKIVVWTVEAENLNAGQELSQPVTDAIPALVDQLVEELRHA